VVAVWIQPQESLTRREHAFPLLALQRHRLPEDPIVRVGHAQLLPFGVMAKWQWDRGYEAMKPLASLQNARGGDGRDSLHLKVGPERTAQYANP
jgi:hypothetical protein